MKKWQAYLDKGTPDNPDTEDICVAETLTAIFIGVQKALTIEQRAALQRSECTLNIWYGDLAN